MIIYVTQVPSQVDVFFFVFFFTWGGAWVRGYIYAPLYYCTIIVWHGSLIFVVGLYICHKSVARQWLPMKATPSGVVSRRLEISGKQPIDSSNSFRVGPIQVLPYTMPLCIRIAIQHCEQISR